MAHAHAPERGQQRREADPALKGQQPEPQEALHDRAADPCQHPGVVPRMRPLRAAQTGLSQGAEDAPRQREQSRRGGDRQRVAGQQKARQNGQQGHRRQKTPAQAVEEPPAVDGAESGREQKGKVLPVAAHPAVQPFVIGQRAGRKAVGKGGVPHKAAAQQRALRRVMREDAALRDVLFAAQQEGTQVDEPLSGKAAAAEGVHVELAAAAPVRVGAAGPGKDQREIRGVRALQLGLEPRLQDPVARGDEPLFRIEPRRIERMQHRADQLPGRAGIQPRVAVERQQKAGPCQCVPVSGDAQLRLPVAQEPRQLEQGPALALPAAPALAVKAAGTCEEVKAAAVLPVQPVDLLHRGGEDGGVRLRLGAVRLRQIGQQPEAQVFSLSPAGKAQLLQPPRRVMGLPLAAEQRRDDAERAPLGRDAFRKIQSGQAPRRQQTQEQRVQHALDELRDRQQQQQRRRAAVERQTDAETQQQRQQQVHRDVQTGEEGTGRAEQIRADVPFLRLGGTDETAGADMLLDPLAARELLQPTQIIEPALAIHPREDAVGVGGQHRGAHIRAVQELLRVEL